MLHTLIIGVKSTTNRTAYTHHDTPVRTESPGMTHVLDRCREQPFAARDNLMSTMEKANQRLRALGAQRSEAQMLRINKKVRLFIYTPHHHNRLSHKRHLDDPSAKTMSRIATHLLMESTPMHKKTPHHHHRPHRLIITIIGRSTRSSSVCT
jgi:hypothetical protein